jgi:DNA-binding TFAR19-related protein (PDSD5 family)
MSNDDIEALRQKRMAEMQRRAAEEDRAESMRREAEAQKQEEPRFDAR